MLRWFSPDKHFIPQNRAHKFDKPIESILEMDCDGLTCWLHSVDEAFLTGAYRDKQGYKGMLEVMKKFLATRTKTGTKQKDSLWDPPFSTKAAVTCHLPRFNCISKLHINSKKPCSCNLMHLTPNVAQRKTKKLLRRTITTGKWISTNTFGKDANGVYLEFQGITEHHRTSHRTSNWQWNSFEPSVYSAMDKC